jgi:hypothetical protein
MSRRDVEFLDRGLVVRGTQAVLHFKLDVTHRPCNDGNRRLGRTDNPGGRALLAPARRACTLQRKVLCG